MNQQEPTPLYLYNAFHTNMSPNRIKDNDNNNNTIKQINIQFKSMIDNNFNIAELSASSTVYTRENISILLGHVSSDGGKLKVFKTESVH